MQIITCGQLANRFSSALNHQFKVKYTVAAGIPPTTTPIYIYIYKLIPIINALGNLQHPQVRASHDLKQPNPIMCVYVWCGDLLLSYAKHIYAIIHQQHIHLHTQLNNVYDHFNYTKPTYPHPLPAIRAAYTADPATPHNYPSRPPSYPLMLNKLYRIQYVRKTRLIYVLSI